MRTASDKQHVIDAFRGFFGTDAEPYSYQVIVSEIFSVQVNLVCREYFCFQ